MNEEKLIVYYNKFNEDNRLKRKHAQVEFLTGMKYIHDYLKDKNAKILDVGAGTGAYSIPLHQEGYQVKAIELVKHNLRTMQAKDETLDAIQGNALDLSTIDENSYDMVLLFGPLYHLKTHEEQVQALLNAKRVCKKDGYILISYCMNEYAVIEHAFKHNYIKQAMAHHDLTEDFHIKASGNDLYAYMRLEDIYQLSEETSLKRVKIISQNGHAEYMKKEINQMDDETFDYYLQYHLAVCERPELLGASRHVLDILQKK